MVPTPGQGGAAVLCALLLLLPAAACSQGEAGRSPLDLLAPELRAEWPEGPRRGTVPCRVARVVDGDTLDCEETGRVRLIGIDAPEREQAPFAARSTEALEKLAPVGSVLLLEGDVEPRDIYGRGLGYLWREGLLVNWALVRSGYALTLTFPPNVQYVDDLARAQERARAERQGLWAVDGFACPPADFRAARCR